jgi:hypothetical protein
MREIKVGMLVSYDYEAIKNSLPRVYQYADQIAFAVDKDRLTWAGNYITIDMDFWKWVENFDSRKKITVYEDSFYVKGLSAFQCETRERRLLARFMGDGGWHVQVDADEYFVDFEKFVYFLRQIDEKKKDVDVIYMEWLTLYKRCRAGYLFVKNVNQGGTAIATTKPCNYVCGRITDSNKKAVFTQRIIHDSLSRTEEQFLIKLANWGHKDGFDTMGYFHFWKAINEHNYMFVRDFGPRPEVHWEQLDFVKAENIDELMRVLINSDDNQLLTVQQQSKLKKIAKLCIPPIVDEVKKWNAVNNYMKLAGKGMKNAIKK